MTFVFDALPENFNELASVYTVKRPLKVNKDDQALSFPASSPKLELLDYFYGIV